MPTEFFINRTTKATAVVPLHTSNGDTRFVVRFRKPTEHEGVVVGDRYLIDSDPNWYRAENRQIFEDEMGYPVYEGEAWYYTTETTTKPVGTSTMAYNGLNPKPVKRFLHFDDAAADIKETAKKRHLKKLVTEFESLGGFKLTKKQLEILDNKI